MLNKLKSMFTSTKYNNPVETNKQIKNKVLLKSASKDRKDGMVNLSEGRVDIQEVLDKDIDIVRNRSVNAYFNFPLATSVVNTFIKYESPLTFQSKVNYNKLNIDPVEALELNSDVEDLFEEYSEEIDFMGELNFEELQKMVKFTFLVYGEVFVLRRRSDRKDIKWSTKYQVIPSNQVFTPADLTNEPNIINGIEYIMGVPTYLYILKFPPEKYYRNRYGSNQFYKIPYINQDDGLKNVFHLYTKYIPGQNRGFPIMTSILKSLNDMDGYNDSEWIKKRILANIPYFYKSSSPNRSSLEMALQVNSENTGEDEEIIIQNTDFEPGEMIFGSQDDELEIIDSDTQDSNYQNFINFNINSIASALSIAPFLISGDYGSINYSSARAGLVATKNVFKNDCKFDINKLYKYIIKYFIMESQEKGYIKKNYDFNDLKFNLIPPKLELMDPSKEMKAIKDKLDYELISKTEVMKEMGSDYDDTMELIKQEREKKKSLGIEDEAEQPTNENLNSTED